MFFRKEREFYAKYQEYEEKFEEILKWCDLKEKAELPSDIEFCQKNIKTAMDALCSYYKLRQALKKWKRSVGL